MLNKKETIDAVTPLVSRMVRESIAVQGGKASQPIWRLADVVTAARPGATSQVHIDGDPDTQQTPAINACSTFIVPGYRVLVLLVEPHGIWVQGVVGTDVQAPYIGAYRRRNAATSLVSSGTLSTISMTAPDEEYDPYFFWDTDTTIVIPSGLDGRYQISAKVEFDAVLDSTEGRRVAIDVNGTNSSWDVAVGAAANMNTRVEVVGMIDLFAGDSVEIQAAQNSGAPLDISERLVAIDLLSPL